MPGNPTPRRRSPKACSSRPTNSTTRASLAALRDGDVTVTGPRGPNELNVSVSYGGKRIPPCSRFAPRMRPARKSRPTGSTASWDSASCRSTVEREVQGQRGVLQGRPLKWVTQADVQQQSLRGGGWCSTEPQFQLVYAFDTLIGNEGRTPESLLFDSDELVRLRHVARARVRHDPGPAGLPQGAAADARRGNPSHGWRRSTRQACRRRWATWSTARLARRSWSVATRCWRCLRLRQRPHHPDLRGGAYVARDASRHERAARLEPVEVAGDDGDAQLVISTCNGTVPTKACNRTSNRIQRGNRCPSSQQARRTSTSPGSASWNAVGATGCRNVSPGA